MPPPSAPPRPPRFIENRLTAEQKEVLLAVEDVLVVGRPGTGKTSVALLKALRFLEASRDEDDQVLFLSFSNAAIQRVRAAAGVHVPRRHAKRLHFTTFHAFCFDVLRSHARQVGMPRLASVVQPNEVRLIAAESGDAATELSRLEREEGRISFDRFLPLALELFRRHEVLRKAYASAYPLILVDEYQDTSDAQDALIELLASPGQVVYLGDPEQRIFDHLEGVRADRFENLEARRGLKRITLPVTCHRSGVSDLVVYGRAVLNGSSIASSARDVTTRTYGRGEDLGKKLRQSILAAEQFARRRGASPHPTLAVMGYTNAFVKRLSIELRSVAEGFSYPFGHRILVDVDELVPAWSFLLGLMEASGTPDVTEVVARALTGLARYERSRQEAVHKNRGMALLKAAESIRASTRISASSLRDFTDRVRVCAGGFTGDASIDANKVLELLRKTGGGYFDETVKLLELRSPTDRREPLAAMLTETYESNGRYLGACFLGESCLLRERLLESQIDDGGRVLTTLHKAKGKEFDAVVIVDGPSDNDALMRNGRDGEERSRRVLAMAIARARFHAIILMPVWQRCPLLPRVAPLPILGNDSAAQSKRT